MSKQQVDRSKREIREEKNLQKEEKTCDRKYFLYSCLAFKVGGGKSEATAE